MRALLSLAAALALAGTAVAADLGGKCCTDLEERVAELEATVARKGTRKLSLTVYGEVNKAILWADVDGFKKNIIDNANAPTRFGFAGQAVVVPNVTVGYRLEIGVSENFSTGQLIDFGTFEVRRSDVWIENLLGRVTLGQTSTATDGIVEITTANTAVASTMLSVQPVSGLILPGLDLPFDGQRKQAVRVDTAAVSGFSGSGSWADDDSWDVALRWGGELAGFRAAAGIGYRDGVWDPTGINAISLGIPHRAVVGSASVMHQASGLFLSGAYGDIRFDGALPDLRAAHVQGGWENRVFQMGRTTLYGEWARLEIAGGPTPQLYGGGIVQAIDAAALDLYLGFRSYDLDEVGGENVNVVIGGARVRF